MTEYQRFVARRKKKQFFVAPIFLAILILGWRYPFIGFFIPLCMFLGIGIGIFAGRKWCSWACPRGSFYDVIMQPFSPKKEIPSIFKSFSFRISVLSFLSVFMAIQLFRLWPNLHKIGLFFMTLLSVTTFLGIILALVFHQRSWCSFCPIGSIINWTGGTGHPLKINSALCTECKLCQKVCPIQIAPFKFKKEGIRVVEDRDCFRCGLCINACPTKALNF